MPPGCMAGPTIYPRASISHLQNEDKDHVPQRVAIRIKGINAITGLRLHAEFTISSFSCVHLFPLSYQ